MTSEPKEPGQPGAPAEGGEQSPPAAPKAPAATGRLTSEGDGETTPAAAPPSDSGWPDLDQLVESVKTKRSEEAAHEEERRTAVQKAAVEAQRVWALLAAQQTLETLAERLSGLGVAARPIEPVAGVQSTALELSRLPKGETATIRIDTSPSRSGPPRTTIQVQRGTQQLSPVTLATNSPAELRRSLLEIAQKLVG